MAYSQLFAQSNREISWLDNDKLREKAKVKSASANDSDLPYTLVVAAIGFVCLNLLFLKNYFFPPEGQPFFVHLFRNIICRKCEYDRKS